MTLTSDPRLAFSPLYRLQWEEAQQRHVILYPEGMVELNIPAAEILKLCDGDHRFSEIVDELERKFETSDLRNDVAELVENALENGWIRTLP
jgi:pyrroloquinoline quinone biosynthesis protein D